MSTRASSGRKYPIAPSQDRDGAAVRPGRRGRTLAGALAVSLAVFAAYALLYGVSIRSHEELHALGDTFEAAVRGLFADRLVATGDDWGMSVDPIDETALGLAAGRFAALSALFGFGEASQPARNLEQDLERYRNAADKRQADAPLIASLKRGLDLVGEISARVHRAFDLALLLFGLALSAGLAGFLGYYASARQNELNARHAFELLGLSFKAEEAARRTLALRLHDDIAQDVAAARMLCERAAAEPALAARAALALGNVNGKLRSLSADLSPPELEEFGLAGALRGLCADLSRNTGRELRYLGEPALPRLEANREIIAYRIVREAMANAVKHAAGAVAVDARVSDDAGAILVEVSDAGRGSAGSAEPRVRGSGFGLKAMRERAALAGAALSVEIKPGGSRVRLTLPLRDDRRENGEAP